MSAHVETIGFRTKQTHSRTRRKRREEGLQRTHPARVALLLARAHDLQARIDAGEYADYADAARHNGYTRARITQIMKRLLLAPEMQAESLTLRFPPGREPITERHLRQVVESPARAEQRRAWVGVVHHG